MGTRHGDGIDTAFRELGVTANDQSTAAYIRVKNALVNHPEILIGETLADALKEAAIINAALKKQSASAIECVITDNKLRDAVAGFIAIIRAVQDVYGEEKMTEAVICKAIEAGSNIGNRSIMGEAATIRKY